MPVTYYSEQEVSDILEKMRQHIHLKLFNMQISETDGKIKSGIFKCTKALTEVPIVPRKYHK